jgi:conjugative relaxase-like TrwC/TraI family protein
MLTMSKALPDGQAIDYYRREYTNARESYSRDQLSGEWHGRLAEEWNLRGEVETEQYERLCEGQHPETGEQLVRHAPARTYENKYGEVITSSEHRAGWDLTFSAPKSASLAAAAGGDERVRQAHRESVDKALDEVERYTQARIGGNHPAETTGRMVAAKFEHDAARPSRATGYAAPQLHTHAVVFNVTEMADGRTRAVQPFEMYRSQQFATAVYRMNLAERLQQLGYEIEVDKRTGAPEIKGFSAEYLEASSPRSAEVREEAEFDEGAPRSRRRNS